MDELSLSGETFFLQSAITVNSDLSMQIFRKALYFLFLIYQMLQCQDYVKRCIVACWREDPSQRPDFRCIRTALRALQAGLYVNTLMMTSNWSSLCTEFNLLIYFRKPNIFDNMVAILEKHASNLEKQVAERTRLLTEEKKKTDALLYSMLPRYLRSKT